MRLTARLAHARAMTGGGYHVVVAVMLGLLHLAAAGSAAQTPAAGEWTGKAVVPKVRDFAIREMPRRPRAGLPAIYHVTHERDRLLFVTTNGLAGWVSSDQFVSLEQAPVYFTSQIRANPRDSFAYAMRAIALLAQKPDFKTRWPTLTRLCD